ncbi:putative inactive leucine-rich repeat receptor-like protein kinase [Senna tora]|uniref:Putative inactive leucine-rich repeat receptor-like protein kinase n=1 Tax=Senna tora TaxID=362788 RepID=A0A834T8A1_9FABA|nr:putative inactive leucine-rich repeat receptor-like protein kinase [Senna tora]
MAKGSSGAQRFPKSLASFMCLVMLLLNLIHSSQSQSRGHPQQLEEVELHLLLSFKSSINDPLHTLSNWINSSSSICDCNNNLTGSLPDFLFSHSFSHLETLDLSNNIFSGKIPPQLGLLSSLIYLDVGGNVLEGEIPSSITNITTLQYLTLASNQLVGEIPGDIGVLNNLKWIYLGYNNLSGQIPKSIGELVWLNHLDLVYNNLSGQIPQSLGNLSNLEFLFLYKNSLTGPIPASIFELNKLVSLDLSDNSLTGEISELVLNLKRLEVLHLFSNNFTGKIPRALTALPRLQVLQLWSNRLTDLSTNNLSGEIPHGLCDSRVLYKLILFSNSLQGQLPRTLTTCTSLRRVRLQNNKLSGELPSQFTKLPLIYLLDVSTNQLSGRIDDRMWDMPALQMLNLGKNNLSGELPHSFGSNKLESLDLSENRFSGEIPASLGGLSELVQLKLSNNRLSGNIPTQICSCKKLVVLDLSHNELNGQIPRRRRKKLEAMRRVETQDGTWEMQFFDSKASKVINMEDVLCWAKEGNNKIGRKGRQQFQVEEMSELNSLWEDMVEIGKLGHANMVKVMGICRSGKEGYLVYEYREGKYLSEVVRSVRWEGRRNIAVGIAKALKYLHAHCSTSTLVLVGEVSPHRVVVDAKHVARLKLSFSPPLKASISISSPYVAPEARNGKKEVTEKSGIYGLGMILIELVTGRSAEVGMESMVEWARYCYSDCHVDMWVDPMMKGPHNDVVDVMNLALHCTATDPSARPCATQVLKTLNALAANPTLYSCVSSSPSP